MRPRTRPPYLVVLLLVFAALLLVMVWGLSVGAVEVPFLHAWTALLAHLGLPVASPATASEARIVLGLRLPRVLLAAWAGAALALAGLVLQGALRTRLAEPVTTGTAAGALLGSALTLFLVGQADGRLLDVRPGLGLLVVRMTMAAVFAFLASALVVSLVRSGPRILAGPLLLGGLGVNAVVGAAAAILLFVGSVGAQTAATVVIAWTFGGLLAMAAAPAPALMFGALLVALVASVPLVRPLDLMLLGEEEAAAGGVAVGRVRWSAVGLASFLTGAAVATVGVIAFVGLLAPRLVAVVGPSHARRMPVAMGAGAFLLVAADALGRTIADAGELPAGVVMALVGAPVLLLFLHGDLREASS